ncbi:endonuclease 1 [Carex littledalei]|uniref:Aspergillus nuclease S1 n=1 Tax=Carex littledalei TaxID=544730 RepID=A0A833V5Y6_9POAL|nr:endonuclease 1 [Carex littledalei]
MKGFLLVVGLVLVLTPSVFCWSKEGHMMTCKIAQDLLEPVADEAVRNLLPDYAKGDLSALCVWADQIRHWYKYRWTSSLHFIDTPDKACSFVYSRDCHDPKGQKDMCVAGAISNFTTQLLHYKHGTSDRRYNLTEALLFLSHFMGDVHQPMHVGFTSDEGGNTIQLHWYRHKSNLHHVWDREIILTALKDYYNNDVDTFQKDLVNNYTAGAWSDDVSTWRNCNDLLSCPTRYATESINLACKWGYDGISDGDTLSEEYFESRFPIVAKRIAQGGVRLAMFLNHIFGEHNSDIVAPT